MIVLLYGFVHIIALPRYNYYQGSKALDIGNYEQAIIYFGKTYNYSDSIEKINHSIKAQHYYNGVTAYELNDYDTAINEFIMAEDYNEANGKLKEIGMHAITTHDYKHAVLAFNAIPNSNDMPHYWYASAMVDFTQNNYSDSINKFVKSEGIEDSTIKIAEANYLQGGVEFDAGRYLDAIACFEKAGNYKDNTYKISEAYYFQAQNKLSNASYIEAIEYFEKANDFSDSAMKIIETNYLHGQSEFTRGRYFIAKDTFSLISQYKDSEEMINRCDFMIAENYWNEMKYEEAQKIYSTLPNEYEYNGIKIADRINNLKTYNAVKGLAGTYNVDKGDYRVTQTHGRTGSSYYWYNAEKGYGSLDIKVKINADYSVNLSGTALGCRYTSYSSISSGVNQGIYSASFSKDITSGSLSACTLYSDDTTVLKYVGNNRFTLSYNMRDNSQDVYFTYTYKSNYEFSK